MHTAMRCETIGYLTHCTFDWSLQAIERHRLQITPRARRVVNSCWPLRHPAWAPVPIRRRRIVGSVEGGDAHEHEQPPVRQNRAALAAGAAAGWRIASRARAFLPVHAPVASPPFVSKHRRAICWPDDVVIDGDRRWRRPAATEHLVITEPRTGLSCTELFSGEACVEPRDGTAGTELRVAPAFTELRAAPVCNEHRAGPGWTAPPDGLLAWTDVRSGLPKVDPRAAPGCAEPRRGFKVSRR
eukprot:1516842-Prymnesium_polylepis.2